MGEVAAVLFDLDGTICTYRRPGTEVLACAFEEVGVEPFFSIDAYIRAIESRDHDSGLSFVERRERAIAAIASESGRDPALGREIARAYEAERDQTDVEFLSGAKQALDHVSDRYPLGLVTNGGPDIQLQKMDSLGITDYFDVIVYAGYDGPSKPDPSPFRTALDSLDRHPEETVHIGNSLRADVGGANNAGVGSVWIDDGREPDPVPDYTIQSVGELLDSPWMNDR